MPWLRDGDTIPADSDEPNTGPITFRNERQVHIIGDSIMRMSTVTQFNKDGATYEFFNAPDPTNDPKEYLYMPINFGRDYDQTPNPTDVDNLTIDTFNMYGDFNVSMSPAYFIQNNESYVYEARWSPDVAKRRVILVNWILLDQHKAELETARRLYFMVLNPDGVYIVDKWYNEFFIDRDGYGIYLGADREYMAMIISPAIVEISDLFEYLNLPSDKIVESYNKDIEYVTGPYHFVE